LEIDDGIKDTRNSFDNEGYESCNSIDGEEEQVSHFDKLLHANLNVK